jgi:hypothetical protein
MDEYGGVKHGPVATMSSLQQDASNAVEYHIDQVEVRRFRRRIDWSIIPALVIVFFSRSLDKQAVN